LDIIVKSWAQTGGSKPQNKWENKMEKFEGKGAVQRERRRRRERR